MKNIFLVCLFFLFWLPSLLANNQWEKQKEQKSLELIAKLVADDLPQLILLELDYFLSSFPESPQQKKIKLQKAQLLTRIMEYSASKKILAGFSISDFSSDTYRNILFLQAKNYFFLQDFSESLIFLQNTPFNENDSQYSKFFYQSLAYLFLENLSISRQIIEKAPSTWQIETKFYKKIKWKAQKNINALLQKKNFTELEKLAFVIIATQFDNQTQNLERALEKLFFFYLQEHKSALVKSLLHFFIGKNLYNFATKEPSNDAMLAEAENFFLIHQQTNLLPLAQSYFYLGNLYAEQNKYELAYGQYSNLLQYVEYAKLTNFVLNYVEISQFLGKPGAIEFLQKAINNTKSQVAQAKLVSKLVSLYSLEARCHQAAQYLEVATGSTDQFQQSQNNFILGKCYFNKKEYQLAKNYLLSIPLENKKIGEVSKMLAITFAKINQKQEFLEYFKNINSVITDSLPIQRNRLHYYYQAKDWEGFLLDFQNFQKNGDFVASSEEQKQLARVYKNAGQEQKFSQIYFSLLQTPLQNQEKITIAQELIDSYQKQKNYIQIAKVYELLLENVVLENRPQTELLIAKNYFNAKKIINAQKWFRVVAYRENTKTFINYTSFRSESFYYLGEIYYSQKKYKSAIAILKVELKRINSKNKWYNLIHFTLAQSYSGRQQWNNALRHYAVVAKDKKSKEGSIARSNSKEIKKFLQQQKSQAAPKK